MSVRGTVGWLVMAALLVGGAGSLQARQKSSSDSMQIKDGVLNQIDLSVAKIEGGVPVVIRAFSTDHTDFGTGKEGGKEKRVRAAEVMKKAAPDLMAQEMKSELDASHAFGEVTIQDGPGEVPAGALVVEGQFDMINPGSRAKRYWVGFGAGRTGVEVSGKVTDASGKTLATFKQWRHSGIGIGGGGYEKFLSDDSQDVGKDVGKFLVTWARGGNLSED